MPSPTTPSPTPDRAPGPSPETSGPAGTPSPGRTAAATSTVTAQRRASRWRPGDSAEVWMGGMLRHRGVVEDSATHLGVVWIREVGTGMRILVDLSDTDMRPL